jgi:3-oxoacyl-[acyl-carrier-protein] synthase II
MSSRVYITGMGVVSSLGLGRKNFWDAIVRGRSAVSPLESFHAEPLGRTLAAEVKDFRPSDHLTVAEARRAGRCSAFALAAARMAVADARLDPRDLASERAAVVLGTTMGEADVIGALDAAWIREGRDAVSTKVLPRYAPSLLPVHVARALGCESMVLTLPAACAAGNYALGFAADVLRRGQADIAVTGASEMLQELQFSGFVRLGAVAPECCQPFDLNRQGLIVGEGAAVFVLETEASVVRRGAVPLVEVGGYGLACDAYHITRPHPDGTGNTRAMREAITRSGLSAADVDFVNAHGTGTRANDQVEARVMRDVFGERRVPMSSIKSMVGHCMGASSAIEAVTCVETILTGWYPPTINYQTPDPECDVNVVANEAVRGPSDVVLNNALAFGGYDAVVCFARPGRLPEPPPPAWSAS